MADILRRLTDRWQPLASFIVVNFLHPELGPAGEMVNLHPTLDISGKMERLKRVSVIPMSELEPYVLRWGKGETVLVHVDEMDEPLRRRYYSTGARWSLNVPVFAGPDWVGLIGAAAGESGFRAAAIGSYECAAEVLKREFDADQYWEAFADGLETIRLADARLPDVQEPVFNANAPSSPRQARGEGDTGTTEMGDTVDEPRQS